MQRVKSDIFRNKSYNNAPVTLLEIHLIHRKRSPFPSMGRHIIKYCCQTLDMLYFMLVHWFTVCIVAKQQFVKEMLLCLMI